MNRIRKIVKRICYEQIGVTGFNVLITSDTPSVTGQILGAIPEARNLIFKFVDQQDRDVVQARFPLERVTSFLSYTCFRQARFPQSKQVMMSDQLDERLLPMSG